MTTPLDFFRTNILTNRLSPILKWAGGKEQELNIFTHQYQKNLLIIMDHLLVVVQVYFSIKANPIVYSIG